VRTLRNLMVIAASLGIVAGCGGTSNTTLSYSAFSTAANAICNNVGAEANALALATPLTSLSEARAKFTKLATDIQDAAAKLKALSGPAALESARDKLVSVIDQTLAIVQNMSNAGSEAAFNSEISRLHAAPNAHQASSELGAPACSELKTS
jgi:hypothetical protein